MAEFIDWLRNLNWYQALALSAGLFVLGVVSSLLLVSWVVVRLPANYFQKGHQHVFWPESHPLVRVLGYTAKNLAGALLVFFGILLSLPGVPGQGILTILIGVMLLDFPGKRYLERWLIRRQLVFHAVNRLRERRGQPPLVLD